MKTQKILAIVPVLASVAMPMTAFAGTNYTTSTSNVTYESAITADKATNTVEVTTSQASTFSVTIPKSIVLNGTKGAGNSATYDVTVTGNIASDEVVSVIPSSSFNMTDSAGMKAALTATVTQANQKFVNQVTKEQHTATKNDASAVVLGTKSTGTVTVAGLTAGSWSGNFNFNISLGKVATN